MNWNGSTLLAISASFLALLGTACTPDSAAKKRILGEVEVKEIDLASRLAARIKTIHVKEGQKVQVGERLIEFDDDILKAKKDRAFFDLTAARNQKAIADHAVRPEELEQLKALVSASAKQYEFATHTLQRMKKLLAEGAISAQQFEEIELKQHAAHEKLKADQAKFAMAEAGARNEQKAAAEAIVNKAETGVAEVGAYDKDLNITAPVAGEVFQILGDPSELIPQGFSVITLLVIDDMWATFRVPETMLASLTMGRKVQLDFPALKSTAPGEISYIAPMGAFATRTYTQDKSSFDVKSFEIRVRFNAPAGLRPGMSAELLLEKER